ncbi:IS3 family transposase [Burkholderia cepacia]|uniref:IS3 family transposase n=1 Tax=Burkholderia cepacia TaxID=292 RepID=UPI001E30CD93|nr:IS3 family transposase [Burkholderia cepacia]
MCANQPRCRSSRSRYRFPLERSPASFPNSALDVARSIERKLAKSRASICTASEHGVELDSSGSGAPTDNAKVECFNDCFRAGMSERAWVYSRDWRTVSTDQFIEVVDSYIRWYNEKRIKISLGALSPIEYRESLGQTT